MIKSFSLRMHPLFPSLDRPVKVSSPNSLLRSRLGVIASLAMLFLCVPLLASAQHYSNEPALEDRAETEAMVEQAVDEAADLLYEDLYEDLAEDLECDVASLSACTKSMSATDGTVCSCSAAGRTATCVAVRATDSTRKLLGIRCTDAAGTTTCKYTTRTRKNCDCAPGLFGLP